MSEENLLKRSFAPNLADFGSSSQDDFERYWSYYWAFSPDYFIE